MGIHDLITFNNFVNEAFEDFVAPEARCLVLLHTGHFFITITQRVTVHGFTSLQTPPPGPRPLEGNEGVLPALAEDEGTSLLEGHLLWGGVAAEWRELDENGPGPDIEKFLNPVRLLTPNAMRIWVSRAYEPISKCPPGNLDGIVPVREFVEAHTPRHLRASNAKELPLYWVQTASTPQTTAPQQTKQNWVADLPSQGKKLKLFTIGSPRAGAIGWQWAILINHVPKDPTRPGGVTTMTQPDQQTYKTRSEVQEAALDYARTSGWLHPAYPLRIKPPTTLRIKPTTTNTKTQMFVVPLLPEFRLPKENLTNLSHPALEMQPPMEVTVNRRGYIVPPATVPGRPIIGYLKSLDPLGTWATIETTGKHQVPLIPIPLPEGKEETQGAWALTLTPTDGRAVLHTDNWDTLTAVESPDWNLYCNGRPIETQDGLALEDAIEALIRSIPS